MCGRLARGEFGVTRNDDALPVRVALDSPDSPTSAILDAAKFLADFLELREGGHDLDFVVDMRKRFTTDANGSIVEIVNKGVGLHGSFSFWG